MFVLPAEKKGSKNLTRNDYIPQELLKMLELPFGYSLLIKGEGGVGKSTLALELLVRSKLKASLLSTRIAPQQVFEHFPWIENESSGNIAVLDATQAGTTMDNPLEGTQIALKFSNIPEFLKILLEEVDTSKEPHFYVIDSWDAIQLLFEHNQAVKNVDRPQLTENLNFMYNAFMSNARKSDIKIVLVAENASSMDYLVDAIVELKRTILPNNKIVRTIEFKKCRGIRIDTTSYVFTLEDGRFKAFTPWNLDMVTRFTPDPVMLAFNESNLRLLFQSLFKSTSPVKTGILSTDPTHSEVIDIGIENLARLQVYLDEMFFLLPPDNFNYDLFERKVKNYMHDKNIDEKRFLENIVVFCFNQKESKVQPRPYVKFLQVKNELTLEKQDIEQNINTLIESATNFYKKGKSARPVVLLYLPTVASRSTEPVDLPAIRFNVLQGLPENMHCVLLGMMPSNYTGMGIGIKDSDFLVEVIFVSGTPIINFVSPQLPNMYGLLKPQDGKEKGINFDVYPII